MSRFFPHTAYAEDQPCARAILTTHVETRAVTTGAIVGAGIAGVREALRLFRKTAAPSSAIAITAASRPQLYLRTAGMSTLWTMAISSIGLVGRMWGREEIEWNDRAWRLMENKGQLETDDWSYGGMAAGLAAGLLLKQPAGWVGVVGSVGAGSVAGTLGYMGWRYGVHGGKRSEPTT